MDSPPSRPIFLCMFLRRLLLAAVAASLSAAALAHSELRSTEPANGATLAAPPERMEFRFNERVQFTALRLRRAGGQELALPERIAIRESDRASIRLPSLAAGDYRVEWRAISADGHPVGGTVTFRVAP